LMGLRLTEGVSLDAFEQRFGSSLFTHYPELREDLEKGLLEIRNGHLRFTERGLALGNTVFMKL
ncbi:MAG: oxygen-independent coproporphyrinogen III oxidase, partial [Bacillota bacterium]